MTVSGCYVECRITVTIGCHDDISDGGETQEGLVGGQVGQCAALDSLVETVDMMVHFINILEVWPE